MQWRVQRRAQRRGSRDRVRAHCPGRRRCLRGRPSTRTSRCRGSGYGFLPDQQRGGCRPMGDRPGTTIESTHRRLGRAPRERHAGDLLEEPGRAVHLHPPAPALSRHGTSDGDRRRGRSRRHRMHRRCDRRLHTHDRARHRQLARARRTRPASRDVSSRTTSM